jgi:DNA polymerase/3'-5' exonuclease PolX
MKSLKEKHMSTWDAANRIEELGFKVHSIKCVVEVIAEAISEDHTSGALYAVSEMLENLSEKLDEEAGKLMEMHRSEKVKKK